MDRIRQIGIPMKEKSGKKLLWLTVLTALLTVCVVFSAVIILNNYSKLKLLNQYILEVPKLLQEREEEIKTRQSVFEEDALARGELGVWIYEKESALPAEERLEKIRDTISAKSVSLTDESGAVLNTTGTVITEEAFGESVRKLKPCTPVFDIYPMASTDGKESEKKSGMGLVMFPVEDGTGQRLVFEFSCEPLQQVYSTLSDWNNIFSHMLSGLDAYAFVQTGGNDPVGYPLDGLTEAGRENLIKEVTKVFERSGRFFNFGGKSSYNLISLQHQPCIALLMPYQKYDARILLAVPLKDFIRTGIYSALTISVFIMINLILFSLYVFRSCRKRQGKEDREAHLKEACRRAAPGRLLLLVAIGCFSAMLLILESRATIAYIGMSKRLALQYDITWRENQRGMIRKSYSDIYETRARSAAKLLTEHGEYRTHNGLKELNDSLKADYLMLFDESGQELLASNSYTGFSIAGPEANLSEEYRAMLLGYPSVVAGPEKDPYTNKQQIGAAILMTGNDGQPDGFLLAVFNADAVNAELGKESLEHTINTFGVGNGYKAAVVSNEDERFVAHTDPGLIGLEAVYYITEEALGGDYEGFTEYDGKNMYVSGVTDGEKTLLFMVPERPEDGSAYLAHLLILGLLLIIVGLYCPKASRLCTMAMDEAMEGVNVGKAETAEEKEPLLVFFYGYVLFFTVFAGIAFVGAYTMKWPAFTFVFGEMWSRGVHLFSIWSALFFVSITLSVTIVIRLLLKGAERQADLRSRTILKLIDSFTAYASGITLVLGVLYMFGVNTEALIASAGIVSIAIGMGSKDMVSDVVAGLFLAIEDSIHMGDEVTIGSWKGRVTDMGIRTTEITDENRNVKILNNSRISDIVNMSRQKADCILELSLEGSVDKDETELFLYNAVEEAMAEMPELYGSLRLEEICYASQKECMARLSYTCAETVKESVTKRLQEFMEEQIKWKMAKNSDEV